VLAAAASTISKGTPPSRPPASTCSFDRAAGGPRATIALFDERARSASRAVKVADWAADGKTPPLGESCRGVPGPVGLPFGTILVTSNNRWITTLAARFGVTNDTWLFYGKAGGGWVGNNTVTGASITVSRAQSHRQRGVNLARAVKR
jgi:hypothetical protein